MWYDSKAMSHPDCRWLSCGTIAQCVSAFAVPWDSDGEPYCTGAGGIPWYLAIAADSQGGGGTVSQTDAAAVLSRWQAVFRPGIRRRTAGFGVCWWGCCWPAVCCCCGGAAVVARGRGGTGAALGKERYRCRNHRPLARPLKVTPDWNNRPPPSADVPARPNSSHHPPPCPLATAGV